MEGKSRTSNCCQRGEKMKSRKVLCYGDFHFLSEPILIGTLNEDFVGGKSIYSFEFSPSFLMKGFSFTISPQLEMISGRQFPSNGKLFGFLGDSSPDRWGRALIRKRFLLEKKDMKTISELDYLLGCADETRMGALRFSFSEKGLFESFDNLPVPPIAGLRELEAMSMDYERNDINSKWLENLAIQGSSLGGARPKATVKDVDNRYFVAKFPSMHDRYDIGGFEYVVSLLARRAGIKVPDKVNVDKFFSIDKHTFLSSRFDRSSDGKRIHTASAMTLAGKEDGDEASVLDLVDIIEQYSSDVEADLCEMFKRVVFSFAVNNTDNHLRNHSFVLLKDGWRLAPMYDVNINPDGHIFALSLDGYDYDWTREGIINIAGYFRLSKDDAKSIMDMVSNAVPFFQYESKRLGLSSSEIGMYEKMIRTI